MDKETLYWLFSTAPQALAAIIGIVFTGLFFMSGNIDNRVREDPRSGDSLICFER